ncbi:MAG: START-like domain-containing protein [Bacteroidia bacterium]
MIEMAKKVKYELEFEIHSSPRILFGFLATPSGLSEWFADNVSFKDGIFTFEWDGVESRAVIDFKKDNQLVKFNWLDDPENTYFQFEIRTDELTSDVALLVTDHCVPDDLKETRLLWEAQLQNLKQIIGT